MKSGKNRAYRSYVTAVTGAGLITGAALIVVHRHGFARNHVAFGVLAGLCLLTELRPVYLARNGGTSSVAVSTTFILATLLVSGVGPAIAAQAVASAVADLCNRERPLKVVFNVAQYTLSLGAAAAVLAQLVDRGFLRQTQAIDLASLGAVILAGLAYHLINHGLVIGVVRLDTGCRLRSAIGDFVFETASAGVLIGMAPVVAVIAVRSLILVPLMLLPVAAAYLTARWSVLRAHEATHDGLTGLCNRAGFYGLLSEVLQHAGPDRCGAVLLIDLDRFKDINDTLGHHTGDRLLRLVGPRLLETASEVSVVARLGGDEFAVLLDSIEHAGRALEIARELGRQLQQPFGLDDELSLDVDASIGVVVFPDHGLDLDTLLQRADVAMYLAKERQTLAELYSPDRDVNTKRRLLLMRHLRSAVNDKQLLLHYQPKYDTAAGRYSAVEGLVRWRHPDLGLVPPAEFIPLAEHTGTIVALTQYVLASGISQARRWKDMGLDLRVAMNLSAAFLHDRDLPVWLAGQLADHGLDPSSIELEITESGLMADPAGARRVLSDLADMQVRLTIDDFGTGYSSLSYLHDLPVQEVKIDRTFVEALAGSGGAGDDIIVRAIIDLARNLGLETTAEGVETTGQLQRLTELGCHYMQGYLFSRPLAVERLTPLLLAGRQPQDHALLTVAGAAGAC